ncbi:flagellar basal body P-ring formation protein FlgA [Thalassotalea sp. M1531]|uniref:Flagella basal body P-ring formation protein FlgA n=1 Tax=Thalassotalea algicola TaxID=2716224 RepID=A0A7Y0Q962_9GAMM|nr:flagellar basal body P-ring formation chaperone FlgA [Thalassotalea algicola]NMP32870.1 flagellar basal body P-ring formation protein FlgA [Thalassotalea algicola]
MSKTKIFLTFLILSCQQFCFAKANTYDHQFIENLAKTSVLVSLPKSKEKKIVVETVKLDPRIVIKPCKNQLSANIPENSRSRNVNVKITCEGSTPWSLYVPVKVTETKAVLIATQPIDKGSVLTPDNVKVRYLPTLKVRGEVITTSNNVIGAKAKRNISSGKPISKRYICLVCKGDNVSLIAKSDSLQIKTAGTSINSGHLGDKVRVRNDRSGKLVTGRVTGLNKVTIIL